MSKLCESYNFNGYEIFELEPCLQKKFITSVKSGNTVYLFNLTEEIRKYMRSVQKKYCKSESADLGAYLFAKTLLFFDRDGNPTSNLYEGQVEITLKTPRLVKKEEKFYPKFQVDSIVICIS